MLRDTQLTSILQEKYGSANTARNSVSNSRNVLYVECTSACVGYGSAGKAIQVVERYCYCGNTDYITNQSRVRSSSFLMLPINLRR